MLNKKIVYIFIISIIIIATGVFLFLFFENQENIEEHKTVSLEEQGCKLMTDKCNDKSCAYYFMCQTDEISFSNCSVYECQGEYKMIITRDNGQNFTKDYPKPDLPKVNMQRENCEGEIIVLDKKCLSEKLNLKIQITTQGDCSIQSFLIKSDNETYTPEFEKTNDIYDLTINECNKVNEIVAICNHGFSINLKLDI